MARVAGRTFSREAVAGAAWRVIRRNGFAGMTIRAVAAELGATLRAVTYYFRNKEDLMLFAVERLEDRVRAILDAKLAKAHGIDRVLALLDGTIPIDELSETGWRLWLSFVVEAQANPRLRRAPRFGLDELQRLVLAELETLRAKRMLRPGLDLAAEAEILLALGDGLGINHLIRPEVYDPTKQRRLLRLALKKILGSRARVVGTGTRRKISPRRR